jgi:hypothetical protein
MKNLKNFNENSHLDWRIDLNQLLDDLTQDIKDEGFEVIISDDTRSSAHRPNFKLRIKYQEPIIYHKTDIERFKEMNQRLMQLMNLVEELLQRISNMKEFELDSASLSGMNKQFLILLKGRE